MTAVDAAGALLPTLRNLVPEVFASADGHRVYNTSGCLILVSFAAVFWTLLIHFSDIPLRVALLTVPQFVSKPIWTELRAARARVAAAAVCPYLLDAKVERNNLDADREFCRQVRSRAAGILNALVSTGLAIYCTTADTHLISDKLSGTSWSWVITGASISGYFVWDLGVILFSSGDNLFCSESCQWLLHALICLSALISPFFARVAPMSYYGALLVLFETSTPFMGSRWFCVKAHSILHRRFKCTKAKGARLPDSGAENLRDRTAAAPVAPSTVPLQRHIDFVSLLFAITFFLVRIVVAPIFLLIPLMRIFFTHPLMQQVHLVRWTIYVTSIPSFFLLNCFWMYLILVVALGGRRRTAAD